MFPGSSCGLRLDLQTGFFSSLSFSCIYWISSALSSLTQRSVHLSVWLTARGDWGSQLFTARLFALALRYTAIPDCEVKSVVSYTGLCQSQIVVAKAQSLEHVVSWVEQCLLWVHIVCSTWHWSVGWEKPLTGAQKRDVVFRVEEDDPAVEDATQHNYRQRMTICVISSLTLCAWSGALML